MAQLSPQQIAQASYNAGFRGQSLINAIAIALAESGGNTNAYNPELAAGTRSGSGSRGIFQIYGQAHPEYNSSLLFDPNTNAQAAFKVYQQAGNRFTPWSTFNLGSYKRYLGAAQNAAAQFTGSSGGSIQSINTAQAPALQTTAGSAGGVQAPQNIITQLFPGVNFKMVFTDWGFIIGGSFLIMIGLIMLLFIIAQGPNAKFRELEGRYLKAQIAAGGAMIGKGKVKQ